jgi:hypothetical protein
MFKRQIARGCVAVWVGEIACLHGAQYATSVAAYEPGTGFAPGYTNPAAALGEPSRFTPGAFGGPVDPFDPPYTSNELVSIGSGGSLTVTFDPPLQASTNHPYALDFLIFSGVGFVITNATDANYNYIGTPATDGSMFAAAGGSTRVSVSADGVKFFPLDPARAPSAAGLYPTDGEGDFSIPVDPAISVARISGASLADLRRYYGGSGGGAGYALAWAMDEKGHPVNLPAASQVRVESIDGRVEIDAFGAITSTAEPPLFARFSNGFVTLTWPTWAAGYSLESSPGPDGSAWTPVAGATNGTAIVTGAVATMYFRLRR